MTFLLSRRGLTVLAAVLIVVANAVALTGVALNRGGAPETETELTERELVLPGRIMEDNSGMWLKLQWRNLGEPDVDGLSSNDVSLRSPAWLNEAKLQELGFELTPRLNRQHTLKKRISPRFAYIVLEFDGPLYGESLRRAEARLERELGLTNNAQAQKYARRHVDKERRGASRLFTRDAGLDYEALKSRYSAPNMFIVRGTVRVRVGRAGNTPTRLGTISVSNPMIHVPLEHRDVLDTMLARPDRSRDDLDPRYRVGLAYGSRLEPWVVSVSEL